MRQNGRVDLIGSSPAIAELKAEIERVARADAKVLITGESGVGKEIVARAIGSSSLRLQPSDFRRKRRGIGEQTSHPRRSHSSVKSQDMTPSGRPRTTWIMSKPAIERDVPFGFNN